MIFYNIFFILKQENKISDIACAPRVKYVLIQLFDEKKHYLNYPYRDIELDLKMLKGEVKSEWLQPGEENAGNLIVLFFLI